MTDEVTRMRGLRKAALKARALAEVLRLPEDRRDSTLARGALLCWQVSRLCTGRLRAHPYPAFQRGPALCETVNDGFDALVAGVIARRRGRRNNAFLAELQCVAQTLDRVRAVTLVPELSDDFGRVQTRLRQIVSELSLRALLERGHTSQQPPLTVDLGTGTQPDRSPYLAL